MILEEILRSAGYDVVGPVARVAEAMALVDTDLPDAALLDVTLGNERSIGLAKALRAKGVPFAFCTGYGVIEDLPAELSDAPIIRKPATDADILHTVAELLRASGASRRHLSAGSDA
jgi:DNA-binding response OmpR family regulator